METSPGAVGTLGLPWPPGSSAWGEPGQTGGPGTILRDSPWEAVSARKREGFAGEGNSPRLLELIGREEGLGPFTAPIGADSWGRTVWHDLHSTAARHLLISAPAPERFGAIRTVAAGLALRTRPALLQLLTIDSTGRELLFLETFPHAIAETAIDPAAAGLSLRWLSAELKARGREGRTWPGILLVIDDLACFESRESRGGMRALNRILRQGGALGIHVVAGASETRGLLRRSVWRRADVAHMAGSGAADEFVYRRGKSASRLAVACLSAVDLDQIAKGTTWRPRIPAETRPDMGARPPSGPGRPFDGGPR